MKSFICEASTIELAIKKALENSNHPKTFFIKVIEQGVESVLFWKKKPFKIAFFYEINSDIFEINNSSGHLISENKKIDNIQNQKPKNNFEINQNNNKSKFYEKKPNNNFNNLNKQENQPNDEFKKDEFKKKENVNLNVNLNQDSEKLEKKIIWTAAQIKFIKSWVPSFIKSFNISEKEPVCDFNDGNVCKIFLGKNLYADNLKNKELCISISIIISEILFNKFKDYDYKSCKIIILFE